MPSFSPRLPASFSDSFLFDNRPRRWSLEIEDVDGSPVFRVPATGALYNTRVVLQPNVVAMLISHASQTTPRAPQTKCKFTYKAAASLFQSLNKLK